MESIWYGVVEMIAIRGSWMPRCGELELRSDKVQK